MSDQKYVVFTPFPGRCQAVISRTEDGKEFVEGSALKVQAYVNRFSSKGARVVNQEQMDQLHAQWQAANEVKKAETSSTN